MITIPTTIKIKRGTNTSIPTLDPGEPAINTQTGRMYIGTGAGNFMYYPATEMPFRLLPTILENGDPTFKKAAFNPDVIDPSAIKSASPVDFRCGYPTSPYDRLGGGAFASGVDTRATGSYSFAANAYSISGGTASVAVGYGTNAGGYGAFTAGVGTRAETYALTCLGSFNGPSTGSDINFSTSQNAFVIGGGYSESTRLNIFRVKYDGGTYGVGAFNSSGADYAEFFEWLDGNKSHEDRIGKFVSIAEEDKIAICSNTPIEDILGVVSGNASVIGNTASSMWHNAYVKDDFGRILYDITYDEKNNVIKKPKMNPEYDPSTPYVPREERREWDSIGLLGRMRVYDDGSCIPGGKCGSGPNGVAISATQGFKVLKRISENVIEILVK